MSYLVTLAEYKTALGITTDAEDARHDAALSAAEQAVLNFTDRDFYKVLKGGTDEIQTVTVTGSPTGGHFKLAFEGQQTGNIVPTATAAAVEERLLALNTIPAGAVAVTGNAGGPWTVTFQGALGSQNVPSLTATSSLTGGTAPSVAIATPTPGVVGSSIEERTFWLEPGSTFLEIDDCTEVTDVSGSAIATWEERSEGPAAAFGVYTYIQFEAAYTTSPEMGFSRNEDVFGISRFSTVGTEVTVTADWGWSLVPEDVKRAVIWTAASFEKDTQNPYGALSSKSVAEVSESYYMVAANPNFLDEGIPAKVQSLLFPYRRVLF